MLLAFLYVLPYSVVVVFFGKGCGVRLLLFGRSGLDFLGLDVLGLAVVEKRVDDFGSVGRIAVDGQITAVVIVDRTDIDKSAHGKKKKSTGKHG